MAAPTGPGQPVAVREHLRNRGEQSIEPGAARTRRRRFDRVMDPVGLVLEPVNEMPDLDPVRFVPLADGCGGKPGDAERLVDWGVIDAQPMSGSRKETADHRHRRVKRSRLDPGRCGGRDTGLAGERADGQTCVFPGSSKGRGRIHAL